jgi:predicted glycosyltransferase
VTAPEHLPPNLTIAGWVETAAEEIASAGIVIGQAGDGLVSAVIAAGRPFICLPQPRPFDEQMVKARRLEALGIAIVLETWPPPAAWPGLLRRAQNLDLRASNTLHNPDGAACAANLLQSLAS